MSQVEQIEWEGEIIAVIVPGDVQSDGVKFFTPSSFSQQLGLLVHPKGATVRPHFHNLIAREVVVTQEVLYVQQGKIEVDLYNGSGLRIATRILSEGDTIVLAGGGHGIRILEDSRIIEVKQGPYAGIDDKTYLSPKEG